MAHAAGTRFGPYEILSLLGAGGMGEVYRARDTRLDRTVAIKVLPEHLSRSVEVRKRFEREARAISSLNHPHICTLYDVGHQDDVDFIVMEYVEGETLAHRLGKGALPVDQVLRYGTEIADALDKAHRQGIVHRDLKPGNIMLTKSGAKLLDFGLAKLREPDADASNAHLSALTTQDATLTEEGRIVGTLQYMAPEQLEGKAADTRTDIFAFGAVLYEMATGRRSFPGQSRASVMAAILSSEPPSMITLVAMTPPALDRLVRRCLAKDPDDRWQTARDLMIELKWIGEGGTEVVTLSTLAGRRVGRARVTWAVATVLLAATAVALFWQILSTNRERPAAKEMHLQILPPEGTSLLPQAIGGEAVVSPDGLKVAFATGFEEDATRKLFVRPLDSFVATPLAGTEGADMPFWSPDSRYLGFLAFSRLKKVAATGGPVTTLCDVPALGQGGTWNHDGVILFGGEGGPVFRVSASGGTPAPVTALDLARNERSHKIPQFLPDGKHFFYSAYNLADSENEVPPIWAASLDGSTRKLILNAASGVGYANGHLLFVREGTLFAQPFDPDLLELSGEPLTVVDYFDAPPFWAHRPFSTSLNGVLVYQQETKINAPLVWFDRAGRRTGIMKDSTKATDPQISPDGRRVAVMFPGERPGYSHIWVYDLTRETKTRLILDLADDSFPIFSPDGTQIAFSSQQGNGNWKLYRINLDGTGVPEMLLDWPGQAIPCSWSPDGRHLILSLWERGRRVWPDFWILPLSGDKKPYVFNQTEFAEWEADFSPDGRWLAYSSMESGRAEIYVTRFPKPSGKWQVSTAGGGYPRWRGNGREIVYFAVDGKLTAVDVKAGATFEAGIPKPLFAIQGFPNYLFDGSPDGERFLVSGQPDEITNPSRINVIQNWTVALQK